MSPEVLSLNVQDSPADAVGNPGDHEIADRTSRAINELQDALDAAVEHEIVAAQVEAGGLDSDHDRAATSVGERDLHVVEPRDPGHRIDLGTGGADLDLAVALPVALEHDLLECGGRDRGVRLRPGGLGRGTRRAASATQQGGEDSAAAWVQITSPGRKQKTYR